MKINIAIFLVSICVLFMQGDDRCSGLLKKKVKVSPDKKGVKIVMVEGEYAKGKSK